MSYANRRQIPDLISKGQSFKGNSMNADSHPIEDPDVGDFLVNCGKLYGCREEADRVFRGRLFQYVIWSYTTPIGGITIDGEAVLIAHKFSPTTSNHQSLARQGFLMAGLTPNQILEHAS